MFNRSKNEPTPQEVLEMNLGKNIAALRKKSNLTQEDLAGRLGVTPQAVSKWENESSCPDIALLPIIADLFGVTVDDLMKKSEAEMIEAPTPAAKTDDKVSPRGASASKKKIYITITQPSGKVTTVNIPWKLFETGLRIGQKFGLEEEIAHKINESFKGEILDEILTVDGENGETIVIRVE